MQPIAAVVALPDGHPLAAKSVIYPSDLIGQRMIDLDPLRFQSALPTAAIG